MHDLENHKTTALTSVVLQVDHALTLLDFISGSAIHMKGLGIYQCCTQSPQDAPRGFASVCFINCSGNCN